MNWIECNLPWNQKTITETDLLRPEYEYPNLDVEMKEKFGHTESELIEKCFGTGFDYHTNSKIYTAYWDLSNKMDRDNRDRYLDQDEKDRMLKALNNPAVNKTFEYFEKIIPINAWIREHPLTKMAEDKNYKISQEAAKKRRESSNSFTGRGLANSGTLMEIKKDDKFIKMLIGDINELGGSCDDCRGINDIDIVVRYAVIWEAEKTNEQK